MPALADGRISVFVGAGCGRNCAKSFSMQSSINVLDFLHCQLAGACPRQHSIVIQCFLLSVWVPAGPQNFSEAKMRTKTFRPEVRLAFADASISVRAKPGIECASCKCVNTSCNTFDLTAIKFPRSSADQYSV